MNALRGFVIVAVVLVVIQIILLGFTAVYSGYHHLACPEVDYEERYGEEAWVVITGGSSGQGRHFALEFAKRGFNLLLIGSRRSYDVQRELEEAHGGRVEVRVVLKDFTHAFEDDFFDTIETAVHNLPKGQIAFLVNNIGHRVAYRPHHEMPTSLIRDTIACGTITQARMTRMLLPYLLNREKKGLRSGIVFITAQCIHPNHGIGIAMSNDLYLPYLAPYEASNAFGFFHANSLHHEYKYDPDSNLDMLIVTPGAVLTSNTTDLLQGTIGAVQSDVFVANIMRLIGNVQGVWSGSWKQGLALWLISIVPPLKPYILHLTGGRIAAGLMLRDQTLKRTMAAPTAN